MKVTFNKDTVITGLQKAIAIMPPKTGAAFLRTVWIIAENDSVTFQSTDANIEFTGTYGADVEEPGMVGVQGQIFHGLISNCLGQLQLSYKEDDNTLYLTHSNGVCKLPVVTKNWFQEMAKFPEDNAIDWTGDFLQTAINKVIYCIDDESSLDALTCLLIKPRENKDGKIDICGLNGHQFAMFSFVHEKMLEKIPSEGLLIQRIYLPQISKWLNKDEISINFTDKRIFFKNKINEIFSVPRVNYEFPDYNNFLSKLEVDDVSHLHLNRSDLKGALNRISTVNTDIKNCTDFYISEEKNVIDCYAKGESSGEVSEKFNIQYDGNIRKITFRTKDLLTILDHFGSENLTMRITTDEGPCGIEGDDDIDYLVVIMPIKTIETSYESEEAV